MRCDRQEWNISRVKFCVATSVSEWTKHPLAYARGYLAVFYVTTSAQTRTEQLHIEQPPVAAALLNAAEQFLTGGQFGLQVRFEGDGQSGGVHHTGNFSKLHVHPAVGQDFGDAALDRVAAGGVGVLFIAGQAGLAVGERRQVRQGDEARFNLGGVFAVPRVTQQ